MLHAKQTGHQLHGILWNAQGYPPSERDLVSDMVRQELQRRGVRGGYADEVIAEARDCYAYKSPEECKGMRSQWGAAQVQVLARIRGEPSGGVSITAADALEYRDELDDDARAELDWDDYHQYRRSGLDVTLGDSQHYYWDGMQGAWSSVWLRCVTSAKASRVVAKGKATVSVDDSRVCITNSRV
ncbi:MULTISPECIES: hypothetical protein [Deefgea]|uniref:Uncharacterized protein n=1 Tax=Deefgea chitinilytica TaxID=570276 RepID=A0ABS2C8Y7_9NEIS|nr:MULTISPECIES: hypothetical protein [Deefgea]MBM5570603.1 hypothetical protein [Deefgea chitinilytica]MBM9887832.1 hypothetical protein [Deefgea sp. CFH1-16]